MIPSPQHHSPAEVSRTLAEILEREGIPSRPPRANPLIAWIEDLLDAWNVGTGDVLQLVAVVGIAILAYFLWRFAGRWQRRASQTESPPLEGARRERVLGLRREAREAEERGEPTLALRLYLVALVVGLGQHGDLEYRAAWTLREILARGRPRPVIRERLEALVREVEPRSFGGVPATAQDVRRVRELCEELLGREPSSGGRAA